MKKLSLFFSILLLAPLSASAQEAEPYAVYTEEQVDGNTVGTLTFYYDNNKPADAMGVGPFKGFHWEDDHYVYDYPEWREKNVTIVVFHPSFANCNSITSTAHWFYGPYKGNTITSITGIEYLNTENVTDMEDMFFGCSGLTSLNLSNFNTENVTSMSGMFYYCSGLTSLDVSNFNTEKVTNMGSMFSGCSGLTSLNLSNFNTANVASMSGMFQGCSGLTSLNVSNFNTANVESMEDMFHDCSGLTRLDVSNFNTENVTYMGYMFYGCSDLTTIYSNDIWSARFSNRMFTGCTSLKGEDGTTYSPDNVTVYFAHPNAGGYFTKKSNDVTMGDVNGDKSVTPADAIMILYHYFGVTQNGFIEAAANVNGDNTISPADAIEVLYMYFGAGGNKGNNNSRSARQTQADTKEAE